MDLVNTLMIAVALAMDCFTVSIGGGSVLKNIKRSDALTVGAYFGGFQFLMTMVGWQGGALFHQSISAYDHWVAFAILLIIGLKMILESFNSEENKTFSLRTRIMLILAVATSIDALGVGISYAFLNQAIIYTALIIGFVSFIFSIIGIFLGKRLKELFNGKAELFGGIILILIGIKIAVEHGALTF